MLAWKLLPIDKNLMITQGITKAITNLTEAHARLGILPSPDATFFTEWKAPLPLLTDTEKARIDHYKQRYLYYADSGAIAEGTGYGGSIQFWQKYLSY